MRIARVETFQVQWQPADTPAQRSAFVRVWTDDGRVGLGEASPMQGGRASLDMIAHNIAPSLIGTDPLDHAVLQDRLMHRLVKLGPEGALSGALAAIDIALWDLKGQLLGQPIHKLLGGAWRTTLPFYASIGGNGAARPLAEVLRVVEPGWPTSRPRSRSASTTTASIWTPRSPTTSPRPAPSAASSAPTSPWPSTPTTATRSSGALRVGRVLEELGLLRGSRSRSSTTTPAPWANSPPSSP